MAGKSKKTILTVAVTGNLTTVQQNPALPCTPEQIANAALELAKIGAAVAHIHVRHPDGRPSMELAHYREVVERIRDKNSDLIINLTTGPGGRFVPGKDDPRVAGPGTNILHPLKRVEHIVALKPDIATLDLNTMWSGSAAVINTPDNVTIMAKAIQEAGSKPELEVFDSGDIQLAHVLLDQGVLKRPPLFQIVMGVRYGFVSTPQTLMYAQSLLPPDADVGGFRHRPLGIPHAGHGLVPRRPRARRHGRQCLPRQRPVDAEQCRAVREGGAHSRRHGRRARDRERGARDPRPARVTRADIT